MAAGHVKRLRVREGFSSVQHLVISNVNIRVATCCFQLDAHAPLGAFVLEFEVTIFTLFDHPLYPLISLQLQRLQGLFHN
jgi:hypothetical protein